MEPESPFGRWGRGLYEGLGYLGGIILAMMTLAVFGGVLGRWLGMAVDGIDELPRYLFVWLVMIGAAAAMYRGQHTMLEYFRDRLPRRGRAMAAVVTYGAGIILFVSFIKTGFVLVPNSQLQVSAGLGLPLGYVYAAMPVGAALIILPMAWRFVSALRDVWQKPS